jgi:hypothetical protein
MGVGRVEGHVGSSTVGEALKDDGLVLGDLEEGAELEAKKECQYRVLSWRELDSLGGLAGREHTYLGREHLRGELSQWDLELAVTALDADLDPDQGVGRDGSGVGRHGGW